MNVATIWGHNPVIDVVAHAERVLDVAIRRHRPVAVFGMFSGGHDSLCATHVASQHPAFTAAVHVNTGIGITETREFVRQTASAQGWPLLEYRAEDQDQRYDDIVLQHGFPGPFGHRKMYNRLKERAIRQLTRDYKVGGRGRILLITGVRKKESTRRMGTVQTINREGARVWAAPLAEWSSTDKNRYMQEHTLPRNPVVDLLHMSGECLCGAFAKPGELDYIEMCGFREVVDRIRNLEARAREAGVPCRWGHRPPKKVDPAQIDVTGPLCHGCDFRFDTEFSKPLSQAGT